MGEIKEATTAKDGGMSCSQKAKKKDIEW